MQPLQAHQLCQLLMGKLLRQDGEKIMVGMSKIVHNNIYSTQYLHMSRFVKGLKKGKKIKQGEIIGYVGSTGLATGPHVCFRFWRNGKQVDPYKQNDLPEGDPISKKHFDSFSYVKEKYLKSLEG